DVDGEREEVRALARLRPSLRRREHHRVSRADDDGAVRLLRELAALEDDLLAAHGHADRGPALGGNRHISYSSTLLARVGTRANVGGGARSNLHSLGMGPVPGFSLAWACLDSLASEPQLLDESPVA